jgi:hypothetical protein
MIANDDVLLQLPQGYEHRFNLITEKWEIRETDKPQEEKKHVMRQFTAKSDTKKKKKKQISEEDEEY